ncbi:alpha/beta hydrolase family protein [Nocardia sp. NPDC051833]|uniref:alpha/beta hydrolase n=1 Tax=Nocardia sp. NPDC051833 TaxID=3155674 RepID=UPI003448D8D8
MRCRSALSALAAVFLAVGATVSGGATATAQGPESGVAVAHRAVTIDGSRAEVTSVDGRQVTVRIYSAAMAREVSVKVQRPADASVPRPALYLVNGAGGGEDTATWEQNTDVVDFLAGKDVNVVMPVGGAWSYYTDWRSTDPRLGVNKWRTFFLDELPALVDTMFETTGRNAIAANSMTVTSVLQLAIAKPGLFRSVAAYSGCAQISDPVGRQFVNVVVGTGGGDASNMYGPPGDPEWVANDPVVNAEGLRGTKLYISNGNGLPGEHDKLGDPHLITWGPVGLANQIVVGGVIEAATSWCTENLRERLAELDIPATFDVDTQGTHSWGYWQKAFKNSWPLLAEGMEIPA